MHHLLITLGAAALAFALWAARRGRGILGRPDQSRRPGGQCRFCPAIPDVLPARTTDPAVKGAAGLQSASYSGTGLRPFGRQACGASPIARLMPKRMARNSIK